MKKIHLAALLPVAALLMAGSCSQEVQENKTPKNIIMLIGDGMGFNHVDAASLYKYGETGKLVFEGKDWLKLASATYPAKLDSTKASYATGYNPRAAWKDTTYLKSDYTDSGAGGTALSTGHKTYNGAIGIGIYSDTLKHVSELAKEIGKAAGIVTSVQISHATPASFSAHNILRSNYTQIAQQQILHSKLDVLIGCGHPMFDNDGKSSSQNFKYVGGEELWNQLNKNQLLTTYTVDGKAFTVADLDGDGTPDAWTLVSDSTAIAQIAAGINVPKRLLGIPQVHSTLQQGRSQSDVKTAYEVPFTNALPSLAQMTMAALNVLNQNPKGFFLMVEGGAIDWAAHDNHSGRLIEEMNDFHEAVASVVRWVEQYSSWEETLIIVTADHETGLIWGEPEQGNVFNPLKSAGINAQPEMKWYSHDHSNSLVPVYARGKGSQFIKFLADEYDPVRGPFVQNTEVPKTVFLLWDTNMGK